MLCPQRNILFVWSGSEWRFQSFLVIYKLPNYNHHNLDGGQAPYANAIYVLIITMQSTSATQNWTNSDLHPVHSSKSMPFISLSIPKHCTNMEDRPTIPGNKISSPDETSWPDRFREPEMRKDSRASTWAIGSCFLFERICAYKISSNLFGFAFVVFAKHFACLGWRKYLERHVSLWYTQFNLNPAKCF